MRELTNDPFYTVLKEYDRLAVDYCLLENTVPSCGYPAHKAALLAAIRRLQEEYPWISADADRAAAREISAEELFRLPDRPWLENRFGTAFLHADFPAEQALPYWYAFLAPPHGTGPVIRGGRLLRKKYGIEDFEAVNRALFPEGTAGLEVYEWSTDWSDYFDAGHEWWGTLCCSVCDKKLNRYAVIMASATD